MYVIRPILDDENEPSRFSMPSLNHFKLMLTLATLEIHSISNCEPTIPMT
jgi:hypothetical protein